MLRTTVRSSHSHARSHFKYLYYNRVIDDIQKVQNELENGYQEQVKVADAHALNLYSQDSSQAIAYLTDFSNQAGHNTVARWKELSNYPTLVKDMILEAKKADK